MKKIITSTILILTCILPHAVLLAEDERLEASLEAEQTSLSNPVYLNVTFYGGKDVDPPEIGEIPGLHVKYVGPATQFTIINGKSTTSVTHSFLVMPGKEGVFAIGPFVVFYKGQTYTAPPVTLTVQNGALPSYSSPGPAVSAPRRTYEPDRYPSLGDRAFLVIEVPKNRVYINEIVPLNIKLYGRDIDLRVMDLPSLDHEGISVGGWKEPEKTEEMYNGTRYKALAFPLDIFGIKEGRYILGPAKLQCEVMIRREADRRPSMFGRSVFDDDFFSNMLQRVETYPAELVSDQVSITVLPLPKDKRPASFDGAVGSFDMDVHVDQKKVKTGDPITVSISIAGWGNLDTVTAPKMEIPEDFKTYEPQISRKENKKVYEQIFIPKTSKVKEIPEVVFSYFDPNAEKYVTLRKGPVPIEVAGEPISEQPVKVTTQGGGQQLVFPSEKLGKDIVHIKDSSGHLRHRGAYLYSNPVFWGGQVVPLLVFLGLFASYRKKEKIRTDKKYARSLRAPRKANAGIKKAKGFLSKNDLANFYDTLFRMFQEYLADRLDMPKGGITYTAVREKLETAGCRPGLLDMVRDVFEKCEMARYASLTGGGDEARETFEKTRMAIDELEKLKS